MLAWLLSVDGFLELLKCWQFNDVLWKAIPIFQGPREEAKFVGVGSGA